MTKLEKAAQQALDALESSKRSHYYCEDTWYSCPKHEEGCSNDAEGDECNCGADKENVILEKAITALREALSEQGCDYCSNTLFAGTSCPNCGRVVEPDHIAHVRKMVPDHIADAGKMVLTTEQAQQIEVTIALSLGYFPETVDGGVAMERAKKSIAAIRAARAQEQAEQELVDGLNTALEALVYHTEQTRPIHKTNEAISQIKNLLAQGEAT